MKSEAAVSSQNYTVAEVAEYVSGERSLWQLVAAETAGVSPRTAGQRTQFGAARLLGILAERGYDWQRIAIEGAAVAAIQLAEQSVPAATVIALLENETSERLGVPVEIITATPFPDTILPQGNLSIHVHFPDKPGYWLPDAVEFLVDGRLVSRLPLTRLKTNFKLTVIVAPGGITARTLVHPGRLGAEEQDLPPGSEVATRAEQVTGMTTRAALRPGERLRLSQLQAPYDVSRGSELTLVIAGDEDEPCLEPDLFLKRAIPTAGLWVMPISGHTINLEEPEAFNHGVADFIARVEAGAWPTRDPRSHGEAMTARP
ncbi:hypothetical protein IIA79_03965 [bacterium]|nr:hypothetical protein [bacterium]